MNVQLTQSMDMGDDEYLERRQVIRALSAARRHLEDERGDHCNFDDPRSDMLLQLVRDLGLSTLEAVEALGAEMVLERLLMRYIPLDLHLPEWHAWLDAHPGTIATLQVPGGLQ